MAKTFFRAFFYSLLGLGVLFWAIGFLLPSQYTISRSTTINAPVEKVFDHVVHLEKWALWSPWLEMDPAAQYSYGKGIDGAPYMSWSGPEIGMGRLDITNSVPNKSISTILRFYTPYDTESTGSWVFETQGNATTVTWSNTGVLEDVLAKWYSLVMKGQMNKTFDKGLAKLKTVTEK